MGHWSCDGIENVEMLVMAATELISIEEDLVPCLTANYDDIGVFVGINNAVMLLGHIST